MGLTRVRNLVIVKKRTKRFSKSWIRCFRILPFALAFFLLLAFSFYSISQNTVVIRRNMHYLGYSGSKNVVSINHIPFTRYGKAMWDADHNQIKLSSLLQRNVTPVAVWARSFMNKVRSKIMDYKNYQRELTISCKITAKLLTAFKSQDTSCSSDHYKRTLKECSVPSTLLAGRINVSSEPMNNITENDILRVVEPLKDGGEWFPDYCTTSHGVAIVIPYRDRKQHLLQLLHYLHPMLQRQQLHYRIFVVEQYGDDIFNKGALMNAAFATVLEQKLFHDSAIYSCFVFHDVDMIPEDDRNLYSCSKFPVHLSVAVNEMNYRLPYRDLVGGVFKISVEHFLKVNGYSNLFWGWGGEDDDMATRLSAMHLPIYRPPSSVGRYTMIRHKKRSASPRSLRYKLLSTSRSRFRSDGLNSMKHKIVAITDFPLYSLILVDVGTSPAPIKKLHKISEMAEMDVTTAFSNINRTK